MMPARPAKTSRAGWRKRKRAASTGVEHIDEVVKYLLAGADVVMTTAAILRHGPEYVQTLLTDLVTWLEIRQIESLDRIRGQMSWARVKKNESYLRANYLHLLKTFTRAHHH